MWTEANTTNVAKDPTRALKNFSTGVDRFVVFPCPSKITWGSLYLSMAALPGLGDKLHGCCLQTIHQNPITETTASLLTPDVCYPSTSYPGAEITTSTHPARQPHQNCFFLTPQPEDYATNIVNYKFNLWYEILGENTIKQTGYTTCKHTGKHSVTWHPTTSQGFECVPHKD